jgi:hypothetical protein
LNNSSDQTIGPYRGQLAEAWHSPSLVSALSSLSTLMFSGEARVLQDIRNRTVCLPVPGPGGAMVEVVVKSFARPSRMSSLRYQRQGGKARRSWQAARTLETHGAGTPRPVGFLERWEGDELVESYFLSEMVNATNLQDELGKTGTDALLADELAGIMADAGTTVRKMHDAGMQHNDLGQVNILLRRAADQGNEVLLIDLNRAQQYPVLSSLRRAKDLSRLGLPAALRRHFERGYFHGEAGPAGLRILWFFYRAAFAVWRASRTLRHPLRTRRRRLRQQP